MTKKHIYRAIIALLISITLWFLLDLPFTEVLEKHQWIDNYINYMKWGLSISYFFLLTFCIEIKEKFIHDSCHIGKFILGILNGIFLGAILGFILGVFLGVVVINLELCIGWSVVALVLGFIFGFIMGFIPCLVFTVLLLVKFYPFNKNFLEIIIRAYNYIYKE